jgi:hypothetical protein
VCDPDPPRPAAASASPSSSSPSPLPPPPLVSQAEFDRETRAASRAVRAVAQRHPRAALVLERVLLARSGTVLMTWTEEDEDKARSGSMNAAAHLARERMPPAAGEGEGEGEGEGRGAGAAVSELRAALARAFPGASPKQPDILHTTVVRLLGRAGDGDPSLLFPDDDDEQEEDGGGAGRLHRARLAALMERLTAQLRGTVRVPLFGDGTRRRGGVCFVSEDRFGAPTHEARPLPLEEEGDAGGGVRPS